jgi:signal transduction histidine kinase
VLEAIADPVTVIGPRGQTLFQNAASRAALPDPPPQSFSAWDQGFVLHSADGVRRLKIEEWPLARALAGETVGDLEASVLMPNDPTQPILLLASATPIVSESGAVVGAVLISRDVTAQRRLERDLAHAQRMEAIGLLAGGVAHDFNNVLSVIVTLASVLANRSGGDARLMQIVEKIQAAAGQGGDIVKRLLSFARQQPLDARTADVNALVGELVALLRPTLEPNIEIVAALEPDLPPALADSSQLSHALLNLAINARDAMPEGGALTFRTQCAPAGEAAVVIEVADTGVGIPFDLQRKVLEPFYTTKPAGKGTGLGLASVHGFVSQSGGRLDLRSAPDRGTTIVLRLPRAAPELAAAD